MYDDLIVLSAAVVLPIATLALLNVAMASKSRLLQAWSSLHVFAALASIAAACVSWVGADSPLHIVPNLAVICALGGFWSGARVFNGRRPRLVIVAIFALVTGLVTYLERPEFGEWGGASLAMSAVILLAVASAIECMRGEVGGYVNGRILTVVCLLGAAWLAGRLTAYLIAGPNDPLFERYFNPTVTVLVAIMAFSCAALCTAMLVAGRMGGWADLGPSVPTFSMGVLDWAAFVPGARDRVTRVRAHGDHSAVLVLKINGLDEINITYGTAFGDDVIRTLAAFLREHLAPTTLIGHRGGGRFVIVGIASDEQEAERRAYELLDGLISVTVAGRKGFRVAVSIGASDSFTEEHTFDELYAAAAAAVDRTRQPGGSRVQTSASRPAE
ncbi:diguanylate cyclase (GGDEF)-like protein [Okibacterium sp. HSC-33S16]|uniref:diguanylate cyclase domain-containing protein n=1 Tax=Okibacterium sp. HSC-33S16 TaxID=2910965 RepID=UPI0020A0566A|nr:diguanylate cyclase [Okibacterium sp. HSC-33S16]MCP2032057.1 diguanylate cyclase (GGDEF)-like protein [Okibacterium sp. HSC-33S16]